MSLKTVIKAIVALIILAVFLLVYKPIFVGVISYPIKLKVCSPKIVLTQFIEEAPVFGGIHKIFTAQAVTINCDIQIKTKDINNYISTFKERIVDQIESARKMEYSYLNFKEYSEFTNLVDYSKVYTCIRSRDSSDECKLLRYLIFIADIYKRFNRMVIKRPVYDIVLAKVEVPDSIKKYKITEGDVEFAFALYGIPQLDDRLPVEAKRYISDTLLYFIDTSKIPYTDKTKQREYITKLLSTIAEKSSKLADKYGAGYIDLCMNSPIDLSKKKELEIVYWGGKWTRWFGTFFGSVCGPRYTDPAFILQ